MLKYLKCLFVGNPLEQMVPPPIVIESPRKPKWDATGRRFPTTTTRLYMVRLENEGRMGYGASRYATAETLVEMVERVWEDADPKDRQYATILIHRAELEVPAVILDREEVKP